MITDQEFRRAAIEAMDRRDQEIRAERSKQEQFAQRKLRELEDLVCVGDWERAKHAARMLEQAAKLLTGDYATCAACNVVMKIELDDCCVAIKCLNPICPSKMRIVFVGETLNKAAREMVDTYDRHLQDERKAWAVQ